LLIDFWKTRELIAEMKGRRDEDGGRMMLRDKTGGGAVMLRPIGFHCVGFWILTVQPSLIRLAP